MFSAVVKGLVATCILMMFSTSLAAASFPSRDIRVIVPWAPGGGTDTIVRKITSLAEKQLPVALYVQNIKGGMSATGLLQLMRARADGYTLGALTYDSVVTVPWQGILPGYKLNKLKLIARITSEPDAIIVSRHSQYRSIHALIEAARASPRSIRVGIQNRGSRTDLTLLLLERKAHVKFKIIAYPGGAAEQKEALLNGEVDCVVTSLGDFSEFIKNGQARGLVQFSDQPNSAFPKVPTAAETGLHLEMGSFIVLAAPAGVPAHAVDVLQSAYRKAYKSKKFQDWLAQLGVTPSWLGGEDVARWARRRQSALFGVMDQLRASGVMHK